MKPEDVFPKGKISSFREEELKGCLNIKINRITFNSTFPLNYPKNDRVVVYHYQPQKNDIKNAVVLLHGWKSICLSFEKLIAFSLAKRGFHAFIFILPFHFERTPKNRKSGELFFTLDREHTSNAYKQAIIDLRNLADFITEKGLRIGIVGSSLGAVALHTLMGVDNRFSQGVSILGGGNIQRIIWEGILGRFVVSHLKKRGITKKDYLRALEEFESFLLKIRKTGSIPEPKWHWFLLDPLTYAFFNKPRKVLMINGLCDLIIPRRSVLELNRALDGLEMLWLPASHFTIYIFLPLIIAKIIQYFEKEFQCSRRL